MRVSFCIRALRLAAFVAAAATISTSANAGLAFSTSDSGLSLFNFNTTTLKFTGGLNTVSDSGARLNLAVDGFSPNPIVIKKVTITDLTGTVVTNNATFTTYNLVPIPQPAFLSFFDESDVLALKVEFNAATLLLLKNGNPKQGFVDSIDAQIVGFSGYASGSGNTLNKNFNIALTQKSTSGVTRSYSSVLSGSAAEPVPEPFTMALGAAGIAVFAKRRKASKA